MSGVQAHHHQHNARVTGAADVPLHCLVGSRELTGREQVLDLATGSLLRLTRTDGALARGEPLPGADQAYELEISAAASPPPARDR